MSFFDELSVQEIIDLNLEEHAINALLEAIRDCDDICTMEKESFDEYCDAMKNPTIEYKHNCTTATRTKKCSCPKDPATQEQYLKEVDAAVDRTVKFIDMLAIYKKKIYRKGQYLNQYNYILEHLAANSSIADVISTLRCKRSLMLKLATDFQHRFPL